MMISMIDKFGLALAHLSILEAKPHYFPQEQKTGPLFPCPLPTVQQFSSTERETVTKIIPIRENHVWHVPSIYGGHTVEMLIEILCACPECGQSTHYQHQDSSPL